MRLATAPAIAVLAAALLAGCGGSSSSSSSSTGAGPAPQTSESSAPAGASAQSCETQAVGARALRATGVSCGEASRLLLAWQHDPVCAVPPAATRSSCATHSYLCLSTATVQGLAVSCSQPGRSIAFLAGRG
jgi:hypothetical protein